MTTWTQPICSDCWIERNPARGAVSVMGDEETCCYCGSATTSGIYLRVNPATVPYSSEDE